MMGTWAQDSSCAVTRQNDWIPIYSPVKEKKYKDKTALNFDHCAVGKGCLENTSNQ